MSKQPEPFHGIPQFYEWLASSNRNYWTKFAVNGKKLNIYVRRCERLHQPSGIVTTIDLANIVAGKPGNGVFTAFLDKYEPEHGFYVENVVHDRFRDFLLRRGYTQVGINGPLSQAYPYCLAKAATGAPKLL